MSENVYDLRRKNNLYTILSDENHEALTPPKVA